MTSKKLLAILICVVIIGAILESVECKKKYGKIFSSAIKKAVKDKKKEDKEKEENDCVITADYRPICGSNRVTYPNISAFRCAARNNKRLTLKYRGVCKSKINP
ncbi:hypothetical protein CHUAL_007673 [Chamberlinius hualienensis]